MLGNEVVGLTSLYTRQITNTFDDAEEEEAEGFRLMGMKPRACENESILKSSFIMVVSLPPSDLLILLNEWPDGALPSLLFQSEVRVKPTTFGAA